MARRFANRLVLAQVALAVIFSAGFWVSLDAPSGYAALSGGIIGAVANALYARLSFANGSRVPVDVIRRTVFGEAIKIAVTVTLFLVFVVWVRGPFLPMLVTYVATQAVYWVAWLKSPVSVDKRKTSTKKI